MRLSLWIANFTQSVCLTPTSSCQTALPHLQTPPSRNLKKLPQIWRTCYLRAADQAPAAQEPSADCKLGL